MPKLVTQLHDLLGACWVLLTLAVHSRFKMSSSYWNWRLNTAFPAGKIPGGQASKIRFMLEYARWAYQIRRLR